MHPHDCRCIRCVVDRSSLGTPEAKAARESVSDEEVAWVIARAKELARAEKHHPTFYVTGRHGCWATCSCGWKSATWREQTGAQLDFGQHLLLVKNPIPKETR